MKIRFILLTVGVIVLVHLLVLFFCFRPAWGQETPSVPGTRGGPAAPDKRTAVDYAALASGQTAVVTMHHFPPLNYQYAWRGAIPELPGSAAARAGILVDANTGNVLWNKNARTAYPIASMTKIMTLLLAYEDVLARRGGVTLTTPVTVTAAAQKIGGSQVWLEVRETFPLEELLKAVSVKSANDAAYLAAEFLGGGDAAGFVARMNRRAGELGMTRTRFFNPHGLPGGTAAKDNVSSPEDMALLAEQTLNYPKLLEWASILEMDFRPPGARGHLRIVNHNNLLPGRKYAAAGVDGLKTGFINRSGYCVTVTCRRGGKRLIAVAMGFDHAKNRDLFVRKLLGWGYARAADPAAANRRSRAKAAELQTRKGKISAGKRKTAPKAARKARTRGAKKHL